MTFFCAKCQKRHDVRDISADMWSICKSGLREQVKLRLEKLIKSPGDHSEHKDDLNNLYNDLLGFIGQPFPEIESVDGKHPDARVNAFFGLNANNLRQLADYHREGNIVSGTYSVRLGTLLNLYMRWDMANYSGEVSLVPKEWYSESMYEQELKAYFSENGVLDKVTDMENVPFSQDGQMLGFTHICPHCGYVLSRASGAAEEIVVALAGAPRAGKTACMVSMLSSLLNGACPGIRVVPMAHDDKWNDLNAEIEYFNKGMKVEKTPEKIEEVPAHSILVQLNDRNRSRRVLTIVDMPGEFWQGSFGLTEDFFRKYAGIYENIDCIWFMISKSTIYLSQVSSIPDYITDNLARYVSEDIGIIKESGPSQLSANLSMLKDQLQKPMPPIMVIVTKPDYSIFDLEDGKESVFKLFPEEAMDVSSCNAEALLAVLKADSQRLHGLNQYPLCEHAANVRAFIQETCPAFLSAIEDNCADRLYTTVSPYGHPALERDDFAVAVPTPYHELYPFLWTLAIQGGLQIHQDCKWIKRNFLNKVVSEEHTREQLFYRYTNRKLIPGSNKERQAVEDRNLVYAAISNNLLMNGPKFIGEVVINHEKP